MKFHFTTKVKMELEQKNGTNDTFVLGTKFNLSASKEIDEEQYLDENGLPNKEGLFVVTNILVQGLVASIHVSHKKGYLNDVEHLRYIISELERGFAENAEFYEDKF